MTVLIPAFNPTQCLNTLVIRLKELGLQVLIVDDGSGPQSQPVFEACVKSGCMVLHHSKNLGKGSAIKTGMQFLLRQGEKEGVVCADADGQHLPEDIVKIAKTVICKPDHMILGVRRFTGRVPWKSRMGNTITRQVFAFVSGKRLQDTQTGLRGYPAKLLAWLLEIPGSRFEYEMNSLLYAVREEIEITEVEIETVYPKEGRHQTNFRPFVDSWKVYFPLVKFSFSSLISAAVDFAFLLVFSKLTNGNLLASVAAARVISASLNYTLNRHYVFAHGKKAAVTSSLPKYALLALLILSVNYGVLSFYYTFLGIPSLAVSKILTEVTIFVFSFWAQRKYVFRQKIGKKFIKCK